MWLNPALWERHLQLSGKSWAQHVAVGAARWSRSSFVPAGLLPEGRGVPPSAFLLSQYSVTPHLAAVLTMDPLPPIHDLPKDEVKFPYHISLPWRYA